MKIQAVLFTFAIGIGLSSCKPRSFNDTEVKNFAAKKGFIWKKSAYLRIVPLLTESTNETLSLSETEGASSSADSTKVNFCAYYTEDPKSDISKSSQYSANPIELASFMTQIKNEPKTKEIFTKWALASNKVSEALLTRIPLSADLGAIGGKLAGYSVVLASCALMNGGIKGCAAQVAITAASLTGKNHKKIADWVKSQNKSRLTNKQLLGAWMTIAGSEILGRILGMREDEALLEAKKKAINAASSKSPEELADLITKDIDLAMKNANVSVTWDQLQLLGEMLTLNKIDPKDATEAATKQGLCTLPKNLSSETVAAFSN